MWRCKHDGISLFQETVALGHFHAYTHIARLHSVLLKHTITHFHLKTSFSSSSFYPSICSFPSRRQILRLVYFSARLAFFFCPSFCLIWSFIFFMLIILFVATPPSSSSSPVSHLQPVYVSSLGAL